MIIMIRIITIHKDATLTSPIIWKRNEHLFTFDTYKKKKIKKNEKTNNEKQTKASAGKYYALF